MNRLVFMLEERSMSVLLEGLLPRAIPELPFQCIVHDGKSDLEKNVWRRLRAWREPGVRFMIVRDNDGADCRQLKDSLLALVPDERRSQTLVRLACQEVEAWYFGDPAALARAFDKPELANVGARARFRDPDSIQQPSAALSELAPAFQKVRGARAMGRLLDADSNGSSSFRAFLNGVRRLAES